MLPVGDSHDRYQPGSGPWTASTAIGERRTQRSQLKIKIKIKHYQSLTAMIQIHLRLDHGLPALRWEKEEHIRTIHNWIN